MSTVGDQFRAERERRGLTIHQAADGTNIKTDHIRALEAGNWSVFSAPVYVRGFARNYARFLRLDDRTIVAAINEELGEHADLDVEGGVTGRNRGPLDAAMLRLSRVRWTLVFPILLGLVLAIALWFGWKKWQEDADPDPLQGVGPGLYQPRGAAPGTLPLPTNSPAPKR